MSNMTRIPATENVEVAVIAATLDITYRTISKQSQAPQSPGMPLQNVSVEELTNKFDKVYSKIMQTIITNRLGKEI